MAFVEMKKRKREEYEMQLFGFHSRAVNACLKSLIQEKIQSRCEKLCESLEKKYKPDGDNVEILRNNRKRLTRAYYLGYKSRLPAIENCIKKLVNIPKFVLLNEDKIQVNQYKDEEFCNMKSELKSMQQRLKKAMILNAALKEEMDVVEQFNNNMIDTANTACDVIENGTKYPDLNNTIIELFDSYGELQRNLDESCNSNPVRNKKRCLQYPQISHNTNFLNSL